MGFLSDFMEAILTEERENTMSKNEGKLYKVGYESFATKDEAVKEATHRAYKDWDNVAVYQQVGLAKFDLTKLGPDLVVYADTAATA